MRYINIKDIIFKNIDGIEKTLKDIRSPVKSTNFFEIFDSNEKLDQIAVRSYGPDAEPLWYHIADQNWESIVEYRFDLSKIRKFEAPIL